MNQQDTTDFGDGHQEDGNDQDWNDEDRSYNGCMFTIGTSGERVCSDCAMHASCNGHYERGCAPTGSSTDDPNYSIRVDVYGFSYNPVGLYCFPPWACGSPYNTSERKATGRGPSPGFCLLLLNLCCPPSSLCIQFVQISKAAFSTFHTALCSFFSACSAFDAVEIHDISKIPLFETEIT